jgi:hypothetical protein
MTLVAASPGQSAASIARRQALVDALKDNAAKLQKAADKELTTARKVSTVQCQVHQLTVVILAQRL